ncbi:MAG: stage III sporulation protein AA [Lachnospiraceae bacterium]|jgi:stage III sporulation protein AA|nr:stage III sporulation protein AA [Lachnospiraceae bacterium]
MKDKDEIIHFFPGHIREMLEQAEIDFEQLQEIRLRAHKPFLLRLGGGEYFLSGQGEVLKEPERAWSVTQKELRETMELVGKYSLYAYEDELKQGYLTLQGGHRLGVSGKAVLEGDKVKSIRYISCLNLRLSHQIIGCGDKVLPFLYDETGLKHTLIISPPRGGKTTLLRDLVRQISNGTKGLKGSTVGVVDERSEICGCFQGIPANDVGIRTDVMDACPKAEGMMMLIRSMAPEVLAVDEIGREEDIRAMETALFCGCRLLATVHGSSLEDIRSKPLLKRLVEEEIFERYVIMGYGMGPGMVRKILDERGRVL